MNNLIYLASDKEIYELHSSRNIYTNVEKNWEGNLEGFPSLLWRTDLIHIKLMLI